MGNPKLFAFTVSVLGRSEGEDMSSVAACSIMKPEWASLSFSSH
jgi:hypothetical protein